MRHPKSVIRRNVRVRELLNEIGNYKQIDEQTGIVHPYINWGKVSSHTIKELIELEVIDLERCRFLQTPMNGRERNLLVHCRNFD
jgi:hypothetical protein